MNLDKDYLSQMKSRWLPGAMYPSEVIWLTGQLIAHRVEVIIECGRQDGVSTRYLGELLAANGVSIFSIDFDEDAARLARVKQSLSGLNVVCVSGDIHWHVPQLLKQNLGRRIAVVQDGPKGWEGLSTLVATAFCDDVVILAQHNLQVGHRSRAYFGLMACNPPFLEYDAQATMARELRLEEQREPNFQESNRPRDHSSLGICSLDSPLRSAVLENIRALDPMMGPWSVLKTVQQWKVGDFNHVSGIRQRQRYSWYRFKAR